MGAGHPLAEKVKKLEDLTRVATERDTLKTATEREATAGKTLGEELGTLKTAYQLHKGALAQAIKVAEASQDEAL
jgi:hypothetical protein